jgi:probable F420-dependent oxidoreductase
MNFGLIVPYAVAPIESPEFAVAFARLAEECGFESIWTVEHVVMSVEYASVYPYDPSGRTPFGPQVAQPDPLIWLAYVAAATKRIRLATGVVILPQRNPLILAKEAASLDRLSGGRLELGVGVGWVREEAEALGTTFEDRGRRADEYIEAMRTLWREPVASFHGEHVYFDGVVSEPRPVQAGGVPIVIGGHSKAAARRAGKHGNGFYPLGVSPEKLEQLRGIMDETARIHGRDPKDIELTLLGGPDLKSAESLSELGAGRVVIAAHRAGLDATRAMLEEFRKNVMERM